MHNPPDELALLEAAVARFYEQPVPKDGPALASYLTRVQRVSDRLAVKSSQGAAAFAETDEYDNQGSVSSIHWIRVNCHLTGGAAADRVAVGQQLESVPESHQSLLEGEIGFAHLAHIARTSAAIEETGTTQPFDEMPLLEKARDLTVGRFIDFCHHVRHAADPEGYAAQEVAGVEARSLSMKTGEGGMVWLRGVLDPEGAAVVRTAIEPLARRNGKGYDASTTAASPMPRSSSPAARWTTRWCPSAAACGRTSRSPPPLRLCSSALARRPPTSSSHSPSRPRRSSGWPATAASPESCSAP
ncbi:MAG TPA: DUF222 domain-containing protein, partial [Verrucomicrobiae bacterium]|nr:DUF222 domain-containing protein [Verrucomicrobiae bacterium]